MSRKKKFKRVLLCALLISLPLLSMNNVKNSDIQPINDNNVEMCYNINDTDTSFVIDSIGVNNWIYIQKDSIKNELIDEVEKYIFKKAPKTNENIPSSIVEHGLIHDIDIMFMVAQTQIETSFGTLGAGRESSRRSLFGVAIKRYSNYEVAINDYCNMLKTKYLTRGRNEYNLLKKYTTTRGARYAENPNYEYDLRKAYNMVNKSTKIKELQTKYNELDV